MEIKVLGSGIDTLVIGFLIDGYLSVDDFEVLSEAKAKAGKRQFNKKGSSVTWFGVDFTMYARGASGYEWVLRNDDVRVCIARDARGGSVMPEVYVTFSSQYLWTEGAEGAVRRFKQWLGSWALIRDTKVSRCDLCIDIAMPFPVIDLKNEVVSRVRGKVEYSEPLKTEHYVSGRRDTGYKLGSGSLSARIYDKTAEIKVSQKEWFRDYWLKEDWDGETTVIRCEFQARRDFLKDMEVNTFEDLIERLADIWRYCTHDWLRICHVGSATNQARWKCKEFWQIIQNSFILFGQAHGVLRYKAKQVRRDHLICQGLGCIKTAISIDETLYGFDVALYRMLKELNNTLNSDDFKGAVLETSARVGNMEKPNNDLVDAAVKMGAQIESVEFRCEPFK